MRTVSEASRIEQAIASAEPEEFDLSALVREAGEAYRALLAPRRFEVHVDEPRIALHGAPELIVQALDKLIDNARSFCPDDGRARIALRQDVHGTTPSVANAGPPLPDAMRDKLFDSLVSVRQRNRSDGRVHPASACTWSSWWWNCIKATFTPASCRRARACSSSCACKASAARPSMGVFCGSARATDALVRALMAPPTASSGRQGGVSFPWWSKRDPGRPDLRFFFE